MTDHQTRDESPDRPDTEQPDAEEAGGARAEEVWVYAGRREEGGKKYYAWLDSHGEERYYAKVHAATVGGKYSLMVTRYTDRVSVYPDPRYTGEQVDETTHRQMEARDIAASARLAALARDRSDARRKALDDAVQPLAEIAETLRFGHERDAFLAHVIRRLSQRW